MSPSKGNIPVYDSFIRHWKTARKHKRRRVDFKAFITTYQFFKDLVDQSGITGKINLLFIFQHQISERNRKVAENIEIKLPDGCEYIVEIMFKIAKDKRVVRETEINT